MSPSESPAPVVPSGTLPPLKAEEPRALPGPGDTVGGYRLVRLLSQGGYGLLYLAEAEGHLWALKLLTRGSRERQAWGEREEQVLARLQPLEHPHIVRYRESGRTPEGHVYIVMQYVPGVELEAWARRAKLTARTGARLLRKLLKALGASHGVGVLHRDVKEGNILVDAEGEPVLVDWGAGTFEGAPRVTRGPLGPGTWQYRTPEALRFFQRYLVEPGSARYPCGPVDDVYALGVVAYRLLTGRWPYATEEEAFLVAVTEGQAPRPPWEVNPKLPRSLGEVVSRMMAPRAEERYRSAREACEALEAALAQADGAWDEPLREPPPPGEPVAAPVAPAEPPAGGEPPAGAEPVAEAPRSRWKAWVGLGVACVVLGMGLGVGLRAEEPERAPTPRRPGPPSAVGEEVAVAPVAPETGPGASREAPPAQGDQAVKKTPLPSRDTEKKKHASRYLAMAGAMAAGCVPASENLQPTPSTPSLAITWKVDLPGEERCPAGWRETHEKWGLHWGTASISDATGKPLGDSKTNHLDVCAGEVWVISAGFPKGWVARGRLYLGRNNVVARITEARLPDGTRAPICMVAHTNEGIAIIGPGAAPGSVRIYNAFDLRERTSGQYPGKYMPSLDRGPR